MKRSAYNNVLGIFGRTNCSSPFCGHSRALYWLDVTRLMGATKPTVCVLCFSLSFLMILHKVCWHRPVWAQGKRWRLSFSNRGFAGEGFFYHKGDPESISFSVHPWKTLLGLARCFCRKLNSIVMKFGLNRLKGSVAKIKCFCCWVLEKGVTLYFRMVLNSDPPCSGDRCASLYSCCRIIIRDADYKWI